MSIGSLNASELKAITRPASDMLNKMLTAVPNLFAAALVLVIAYVVARIVTSLLAGIGFNNVLARLGLTAGLGERTPAETVGYVILVAVML